MVIFSWSWNGYLKFLDGKSTRGVLSNSRSNQWESACDVLCKLGLSLQLDSVAYSTTISSFGMLGTGRTWLDFGQKRLGGTVVGPDRRKWEKTLKAPTEAKWDMMASFVLLSSYPFFKSKGSSLQQTSWRMPAGLTLLSFDAAPQSQSQPNCKMPDMSAFGWLICWNIYTLGILR